MLKKIPKFVRFVLVGVLNTLIDIGILNSLIALFGLSLSFLFPLYKSISFLCAVTNSYFMNKRFTFEVKQSGQKTFYQFVLFSLIGLLINVGSASLFFHIFSASGFSLGAYSTATLSGVMGTLFGFMVNYLCYNYFVFK